jgi:epidermal growth factor receptor substrate 15
MTNFSIDEILGSYQTIYDVYFSQADSTGSGVIGALDVNNFLKQSKLSPQILKDIWDLADPTGKGYLDRQGFYVILKYAALAQSNQQAILENLNLPAPPPKLGELSSNITSLISPDDPWYIKASSRINYDKIFDSLSPINNKITGARVKPFLMNTGLPVDVLGKIWELSDLDQDGQLDRDEFLIALQLINKAKEGQTIPDQLPPSLLPFKVRHSSIPNIGNAYMVSTNLNGTHSGINSTFSITNETKPWVVTFEEKSQSDVMFHQIDTDKDGLVTGVECKDVLLNSGLSHIILANIWRLCDINSSGKLNCEQFALAMHFINKKIATGLDVPPDLSPEMIPPSLRPKPVLTEETHVSKEFEELQTEVTELQREKLYYEQRASEHEIITRQKRTELSNLELEMESLQKTQQERQMKRVQEQKILADFEDKLVKLNTQQKDFRQKYELDNSEIEKLKLQIQHMDAAMKSKDQELMKIKTDLHAITNEQASLEARISARKAYFNEMTQSVQSVENEITKNNSKFELLQTLQSNLNKIIKEYDKTSPVSAAAAAATTNAASSQSENLNNEIQNLENQNLKLKEQIKASIESNVTFPDFNSFEKSASLASMQTEIVATPVATPTPSTDLTAVQFQASDLFDNFPAQQQQQEEAQQSGFALDDPFQVFDPFNNNDPFKSAPVSNSKIVDPFANAFDPFSPQLQDSDSTFCSDDPFSSDKRKPPPPRPAPPRPQTPSLKPLKKLDEIGSQQRPQSAMDFTRNTKVDINLFNDFSDPFKAVKSINNAPKDPFMSTNTFDWSSMGSDTSNNSSIANKVKDPFDPFA